MEYLSIFKLLENTATKESRDLLESEDWVTLVKELSDGASSQGQIKNCNFFTEKGFSLRLVAIPIAMGEGGRSGEDFNPPSMAGPPTLYADDLSHSSINWPIKNTISALEQCQEFKRVTAPPKQQSTGKVGNVIVC